GVGQQQAGDEEHEGCGEVSRRETLGDDRPSEEDEPEGDDRRRGHRATGGPTPTPSRKGWRQPSSLTGRLVTAMVAHATGSTTRGTRCAVRITTRVVSWWGAVDAL